MASRLRAQAQLSANLPILLKSASNPKKVTLIIVAFVLDLQRLAGLNYLDKEMTPKEARTWQLIPTNGNPCVNPEVDANGFYGLQQRTEIEVSVRELLPSACGLFEEARFFIRTQQTGASEPIWLHTLGSMKLQNVILEGSIGSYRRNKRLGSLRLDRTFQHRCKHR